MKSHLLLTVLVLSINLGGCTGKKTEENRTDETVTVRIQKAELASLSRELNISGNIEGNKTVRLGFMVAGKVNSITTEEGGEIKANHLLAGLDPENYSIAKEMADANLDQTQDEYSRLKLLYDRKSLPESDFSKITNALRVAGAQQRLQAKNLADTRLYSPISGVLLARFTEVGEIINAGMPLFVVSDISTVKVKASVPESDLHFLHIGNEASVYVASLDSSFTGRTIEIGSVAEASTRTFSVKIELKNPGLLIRPGMTAEVKIVTGKTRDCIMVPAVCVLHDPDNSSYVYVPDTVKKQAFKRQVSLGKISDDKIELVSGIKAGEPVVVSGQQKLSNGSSINF